MFLTTEIGEDLVEKRNKFNLANRKKSIVRGPEAEIHPESLA
jgi:hypothetical protein